MYGEIFFGTTLLFTLKIEEVVGLNIRGKKVFCPKDKLLTNIKYKNI